MLMKTTSIMISGVGGQGTLFASMVFGQLALDQGFDVKLSEVHGMAQRGGSVVTHVRMGDRVYSPVIDKGGADILLAFEELEALRYLSYVKKGGQVFVNSQQILPMPVITGAAEYPLDILTRLEEAGVEVKAVPAQEMAQQAGSIRMVNTVMIGTLARQLDIPREAWHEAIRKVAKPAFVEMNLKAFDMGYNR